MTSAPIAPDIPPATTRRPASWPVLLLALPAFVAIWSGWVGLGSLTGFGVVRPLPGIWDAARLDTAITLPIGVETYAAYALKVWLSGSAGPRAARFARASALGSLVLGAAGQVAYHLMSAAHVSRAPWPITALVACLPVAVLGMGAALAHLVTQVSPAAHSPVAAPEVGGGAVAALAEEAPADDASTSAPQASDKSLDSDLDSDLEGKPEPVEPVPAPRPAPRVARSSEPARPSRPVRSAAARGGRPTGSPLRERVVDLRAEYPDWTLPQIAAEAGCAVRTARRHLNTPSPTAAPQPVTESVAA